MRLQKCCTILSFAKLVLIIINIHYIISKKYSINPMYYSIYKRFISDNFFRDENMNCDKFDPIYLMGERFKRKPIILCKNKESSHICFQNSKYDNYNKVSRKKFGVICKIKNFVLDPLKSRGNKIYRNYFNSWNYDYKNKKEDIKELAPGKTILLLSRNQDSPNIFHGLSDIINVISTMYFFHLKPKNIQILFLESMELKNDPFYPIYKNLISRGGKPIFIRNLDQKYHIDSAIHVPINLDSPLFIDLKIPKGYPDCKIVNIQHKLIIYLII